MEAPDIVKKAAKSLIDRYGGTLNYLGEYEGADAFVFQPNEELVIGYPHVYLFKQETVEEITEEPALYIIDLLAKDVDEI